MRKIFLGAVLALLSISVYWNYQNSKSVKSQQEQLQHLAQQLADQKKTAQLAQQAAQQKSTLTRQQQQQKIEQIRAQLQIEATLLKNMGDVLNKANVSGGNQVAITQVNKEIATQNEVIREAILDVQNKEEEIRLAQNQGHNLSDEQKAYRAQQLSDLDNRITTTKNQIKLEQQQQNSLKRNFRSNRFNNDLREQIATIQTQIQNDQANVQQYQNQKNQFSQDWSSQKNMSDAEVARYKQGLQDSLAGLKARRDTEKEKLSTMTRALSDLRNDQKSRDGSATKLSRQYQEQKEKVQALERELKDQNDILQAM